MPCISSYIWFAEIGQKKEELQIRNRNYKRHATKWNCSQLFIKKSNFFRAGINFENGFSCLLLKKTFESFTRNVSVFIPENFRKYSWLVKPKLVRILLHNPSSFYVAFHHQTANEAPYDVANRRRSVLSMMIKYRGNMFLCNKRDQKPFSVKSVAKA